MFGMNYEEIGSLDKGLILKSSGKIKIQWGKKFIDLIDSNGNLKVKEPIKSISSIEDIRGNGFYYLENSLIAKVGNDVIQLSSDTLNIYVSFLNTTEHSGEEKENALRNIGLVYDSYSEENLYPTNGIFYIIDEDTLYKAKDGNITKCSFIKNPIREQLKILKEDNSEGALIISGSGRDNSLVFDALKIYAKENNAVYDSNKSHIFLINGNVVLEISKEGLIGNGFQISEDGISFDNNNVLESVEDCLSKIAMMSLNKEYYSILNLSNSYTAAVGSGDAILNITIKRESLDFNAKWILESDDDKISFRVGDSGEFSNPLSGYILNSNNNLNISIKVTQSLEDEYLASIFLKDEFSDIIENILNNEDREFYLDSDNILNIILLHKKVINVSISNLS